MYILFNPILKNLNKILILEQYKKDKNDDEVIKSFDHFHKKYPDFNIYFYKNANNLSDKSDIECYVHWVNYGRYNNFLTNKDDFYKAYPSFNHDFYKEKYNLDFNVEEDILIYYLKKGKYNNHSINEKESMLLNNLLEKIDYDIDFQSNKKKCEIKNKGDNKKDNKKDNKEDNKEIIKIYHIFVHFFKCGGGEIFIHNFVNYCSKLENILKKNIVNYVFLNSTYQKNIDTINIFQYNNIEFLYYKNKEELESILCNNTCKIIIDHQYYLFNQTHLQINKEIIYFIHCIDYYKKIINKTIKYSINLYNEHNYNDYSWNNIIKNINYLGVHSNNNYKNILIKIENRFNQKKYDIKRIAIVGRIDNHKFNMKFLNLLIQYINIHEDIEFNIYGNIEKTYQRLFLNKIKNYSKIIFHGYIEYEDVEKIYTYNDILIHPSKSEAGGTVILEAMNNGLPIIARNKGGNIETLNNKKYLVNTDEEYFHILDQIINRNQHENIFNYETILYDIINSKKKILLHHNNNNNFDKLFHSLNSFTEIEETNTIPNIVHYIYGLKEQNEEFPFLFYYGILSNILINNPIKIFFHYTYLPHGYWWNKIQNYLTLNYINFNNLEFNGEKVKSYAHKSDYIRLMLLYKYGGIYYDIDTLCVKSHNFLLKEYDLVLGIQEKYKNNYDLIGNAIMMCKKGNTFIKSIIEQYSDHFKNDEWTSASLFLPTKLYNNLNKEEKEKINLVNKKYFYYPNYNEENLTFHINNDIDNDLVTYHYCNNYVIKYIKDIQNVNYLIHHNNLFSNILKKIYNYYIIKILDELGIKNEKNIKDKKKNYLIIEKQIENYIIFIQNKNINEIIVILKNIILLENLFFYNIHIFIYHNDDIYDHYDLLNIINKITYFKNIPIYYVQLYNDINIDIITQFYLSVFITKEKLVNNNLNFLLLNKFNHTENYIFIEDLPLKIININSLNDKIEINKDNNTMICLSYKNTKDENKMKNELIILSNIFKIQSIYSYL